MSKVPKHAKYRLLFATIVLVLIIFLGAVPGFRLPFVFFVIPGALLCFGLLGLMSLWYMVRAMLRRNVRRAIAEAVVVVLMATGIAWPRPFYRPLGCASSYVGLAFVYPSLSSSVDRLPKDAVPHVIAIETDGFLDMCSGYAYDDSGEVQKEAGTQSQAWREQASKSALQGKYWAATRLIGHYYRWGGNVDESRLP
ncbi:MAG: hypothetical protein PHX83_02120 [Acidobacteriia bacterium]|nr:hypothetical protein [Terriglobia bacterium]